MVLTKIEFDIGMTMRMMVLMMLDCATDDDNVETEDSDASDKCENMVSFTTMMLRAHGSKP